MRFYDPKVKMLRRLDLQSFLFSQLSKCLFGADTRRHKTSWMISWFPGSQQVLRSCSSGSGGWIRCCLHLGPPAWLTPCEARDCIWDVVSLSVVAHPGHEAYLALPGTQAQLLPGPDSRVGLDRSGCGAFPCLGSLPCLEASGKSHPLSGCTVLVLGALFFHHQRLVFPGTEVGQI